MKKLIIITVILLTSINSMAQNKNTCGKIYYTHSLKLHPIAEEEYGEYMMKFNNEASYSEEINIKSSSDKTTIKDTENDFGTIDRIQMNTKGRKNLTPKFYYNHKDGFYFMNIIMSNESLLVKENKYLWNWKLHQETKQVGNFACQKATIRFRGRDYTAWFTKEIPVPFGPWKFQGLPGLILEVYDTEKKFYITTHKVEIGQEVDCVINVAEEKLTDALTIPEFIFRMDELLKEAFAEIVSKFPKGAKVPKYDKNCKGCPKPLEIFDEGK